MVTILRQCRSWNVARAKLGGFWTTPKTLYLNNRTTAGPIWVRICVQLGTQQTRHVPWQKIKVQDPQGPASSIHFRTLGSQDPASNIHFRILGSQGLMSSIHFRILGFQGPTSSIHFRIQGSKVPRQVQNSGSWVPKVP